MDEREWRLFTRAHPEFAGMAPGQTLADVAAAWLVEKRRVNLPSGSHAERPVQASRRQEYGTTHARGSRAQQAGKLEARLLLA
jgi:hypothetical protein